ncbi:MAG: hypothetical protein OXB96_03125 [Candidatus Kaiserbacteria bacterium]|nr:hypothetical protein [Candidatus Kaiserbacteria bacterium]
MLPDFSKNFVSQASPHATSEKGVAQQEKVTPPVSPTKQVDVRYILAVLVLVLSIIGIGALFGLNAYLDREIVVIEENIGVLEETIKVHDIRNLATFDKQSRTLKNLAVSRGGYSLLLAEVSQLVIPGVHYSSVSITSVNDSYTVTVKGVADSLVQYHQQIQHIEATEGLLADGSFDGYSLQHNESGGVTVLFTVSFVVTEAEVAEVLTRLS